MKAKAGEYKRGSLTKDVREALVKDVRLTDGGVYDNHGLEPVWKDHAVILVSDGGGTMQFDSDQSWFWRLKRFQEIQESQSRGLRRRMLIAGYRNGTIGGAYWGIASACASYDETATTGYTKSFASDVIARIRTDLDAFSADEAGVLMNHGYALADQALRSHAPELLSSAAQFQPPRPELMPASTPETELRKRLSDSGKRRWRGRR